MQNRTSLVQEQDIGEVKELLNRPWWRRAWIMQEAVVARKVVLTCGQEVMQWDNITSTIKSASLWRSVVIRAFGIAVDEKDSFPDDIYRIINSFRSEWANKRWNISVYELLYEYRRLECGWAHDRIYAFLGLAPALADFGIVPDYTLPAAEIYQQFARIMMAKMGTLDILNCTKEWRGVVSPKPPAVTFSLVDQARYHDIHALITDGPGTTPRRGWARLPPGWERVSKGKSCSYVNHNTGEVHEKSPLEGCEPIPVQYYAYQRFCPKDWLKDWDNLGRTRIAFESRTEQPGEGPGQKTPEQKAFAAMPRWVPNWAARTSSDPAPFLDWNEDTPRYWASGKSSRAIVPELYTDTRGLNLEGFLFDEVELLTQPWHPPSNTPPFSRKGIDVLASWEALAGVEYDECPYASTGGRRSAFWRTTIADRAGAGAAPAADGLLVETWFDHVGWLPELTIYKPSGI
jgi:hypothetical protein